MRPHATSGSLSVPYAASTQRRHISILAEKVQELSREDRAKQRMLVSALACMFGGDVGDGDLSTQDAKKQSDIKDGLFSGVCEVLGFLQTKTGRATNHVRVVV